MGLFLGRDQIAAVDPVAAIALVVGLEKDVPVALGGEQPGLLIECFVHRALLFSVGEKGFKIRLFQALDLRVLVILGYGLGGGPVDELGPQGLEEVGLAIDICADHFAVDGNRKTDWVFLSRQLAVHVVCIFLDQFLNLRIFQCQLEAAGAIDC